MGFKAQVQQKGLLMSYKRYHRKVFKINTGMTNDNHKKKDKRLR